MARPRCVRAVFECNTFSQQYRSDPIAFLADSRIADIDAGLKDLVATVRKLRIRSIAISALACGNGGLDWNEVRPRIEAALTEVPEAEVLLYPPG